MSRSPSKRRLVAGIESIQAEASGALQVSIVSSETGCELMLASMLGDQEATALLQAVSLAFSFCDACAADPRHLMAKASEGLRRLWPDLRAIEITHPDGGSA